MPYPDHYRAVIDGVFTNNAGTVIERWSTSYRVAASNGFTSSALNESDYIDNELTDFANRLINLSGLYPSTVRVEKLSFNRIAPTGRYADSTSHFKELPGGDQITGSVSASIQWPLQLAVVATLRSDKARGPASHGRMFLPMPQVGMTDNRVIHPTDVTTLCTAVRDAFEHADGTQTGLVGSRFYPALVTPKGTAGEAREVLSVEVGSVVDTMRSRRTSLVEARVSQTLT